MYPKLRLKPDFLPFNKVFLNFVSTYVFGSVLVWLPGSGYGPPLAPKRIHNTTASDKISGPVNFDRIRKFWKYRIRPKIRALLKN
jgi:hypothetical protein